MVVVRVDTGVGIGVGSGVGFGFGQVLGGGAVIVVDIVTGIAFVL